MANYCNCFKGINIENRNVLYFELFILLEKLFSDKLIRNQSVIHIVI